ncbi:MAG: Rrf2 family transcriptional regulator, partial [Oscillospiraceae bacterium]
TAGEILRTLEGSMAPVSCCDSGECCDHKDICVTIDLWKDIQSAVDGVVNAVTLQDLMEKYYTKQAAAAHR